ncbi:MAG: hypothetical protein J6Z12_07035 [Paludibacteraceae bacterium]|nr:hypothetical protein [Paludibacteraceae bacterium]
MNDKTRHILQLTGVLLALLIIAGYLTASAWWLGGRQDDTPCRNLVITVEDSSRYNFVRCSDLQDYLKSKHVQAVGGTVGIADARRIEQTVRQMNLVRRAECFRGTDGTLYLQVWQRCPQFRVITPLRSYYVDDQRTIMPTSNRFTANLPVVTGNVDTLQTCGELYDLVHYISTHEFWAAHIGEICVDDAGEVTLVTCRGVKEIQLGDLSDYVRKMQTVYAWLSQYPDEGLDDRYRSVNVAYDGLLYARKNEIQPPKSADL